MALGNLKARNASTFFGLAWWVFNPILLGAVYYFVFGIIWDQARGNNYVAYLLTGIFVLHFTAQSMTGGANAILQNSRLLANLKFPRMILPIANLIEGSFGFMAAVGVLLFIVAPIESLAPGWHTLWLLVIIPLHIVFNLGLGTVAARLAVPFRDINNIIPYITRLWLYLSPVIWPLDLLDGKAEYARTLAQLNPLWHIIAVYRGGVMGTTVTAANVWLSVLAAVSFGLVGVGMFVRHESKMVRYL